MQRIGRRRFLPLLAAGASACGNRPKKRIGYNGQAFVANSDGSAVAAVDLTAFVVTRHIALPANPVQVLNHPARPAVYALAPSAGAVYEIHPEKLQVVREARGAVPGASHMKLSADGRSLWVLCPAQRQLVRIDTAKFTAANRVSLGAMPVDFEPAPGEDASRGLMAVSYGPAAPLQLLREDSGKVEWTAPQPPAACGAMLFRRDGRLLLTADTAARSLKVYDVPSRRLAVELPLAVRPERMCVKADGGQIFIAGEGADAVVTVYPYQTEVANTMLAGRNPGYLAVSDEHLLVANPRSNDVTIVNVANQKVMAVASVGREPTFIAITPDGEFALVLNRESGDIAVLHIATVQARRTKSAPLVTMIPVGSKPVSAAIRAL